MKLFNRGKNADSVPQEVQEYYQAEKRQRMGIAWVLALTTLVVTVLLALALFFGGRWLYRKMFNNDKPVQTTQESETAGESESDVEEKSTEEKTESTQSDSELPGNSTETESPQPPAPRPRRNPQTGPTLPETGPSTPEI